MEQPLLNDPKEQPTAEVLQKVMAASYPAYQALMQEVNLPETPWQVQWRYYNDGKAWLCKVSYKKKTVFWLSVWEACFKVAFYFTEKNSEGLMNLSLDASVKEAFAASKPIGKLLPLVFSITRVEQISEVMQVANYKKGLK